MIGKTLSHYKIIDKLGSGGMGDVYRAKDLSLERHVALKVLPDVLSQDPERRKRFEREAKAVASLNHPNIVTIHSVEEADGVHFITMELVEGDTLGSRIPGDGMALDKFFDIAIPLADAVSAAHAKGVAHRDLKPANIMIDGEGRLKVLDFGLAKLFEPDREEDATVGPESDTAEGKVLGTASYMSPEQADGSKVDHRTDVFSLGILFYEMTTGDRPFKGKTSISTLSAIMRDTPAPLSDIKPTLPRHLSRIIRRCLEKDPGRRFQTVLDIRNDLQDLKEETAVDSILGSGELPPVRRETTSDTDLHPPSAARRRNPLLLILPIAVVAVAVVGFFMTRTTGPARNASAAGKRLVVLPFENLGAAEDEYFADGITDEITAKLAGIPDLAVISRASAKKYKGTDKSMRTIGSELKVDYVLEGTIRWDKSGALERVRITPQLIDVTDDSNLWAENYEREIDGIFAVQADIAKQIAGALDVTLGSTAVDEKVAAPTRNVEAYQAYLRSLQYDEEDEEGLRRSVRLLERAVELDPTFTVAWAELSKNHSGMHHYGFDKTSGRREAARQAMDRAMALAPTLIDSYIASGYYHYWCFRDYDRALESIDFAEGLNPNDARVLAVKAFVLRRQGRVEDALAYMVRSADLDPQNGVTHRDVAYTLTQLERYDEAEVYYKNAIAVAPDFSGTYDELGWLYILQGDTASAALILDRAPARRDVNYQTETLFIRFALRRYDEVIQVGSQRPEEIKWQQAAAKPGAYWVARAYEKKGQAEQATQYHEITLARLQVELEKRPDDYRLHVALSLTYAALGQRDDALLHSERAAELMPMSLDLMNGAEVIYETTETYIRLGDVDRALDDMELLLGRPIEFSVGLMAVEPAYDPIRENPRFQDLMAKYAPPLP